MKSLFFENMSNMDSPSAKKHEEGKEEDTNKHRDGTTKRQKKTIRNNLIPQI